MIIAPIKELKDGAAISAKCHEAQEPIFITKNGYDDMVIMSTEVFNRYEGLMRRLGERESERQRERDEIARDFRQSMAEYREGDAIDATEAVSELRSRYGI